MPALEFVLSPDPIPDTPPAWHADFGAEVSFYGVVRGTENGEDISGIEYTAYPAMVDKRATELDALALNELPVHRAKMVHRVGFVPVAEPSVVVQVGSRHSEGALEACRWYLRELKRTVPIWKRFVFSKSP